MFRSFSRIGFVGAAALLLSVSVFAEEAKTKGDPYSLSVCPVSGEPLGTMGDPIIAAHGEREVRFCCSGCPKQLTAAPAKFLSKIDALMTADQVKHYPLKTDVVSGKELGEKPVDLIHNNRLVRLGGESSVAKFKAEPDAYIAKLDAAVIAKQSEKYPFKVCVVSGEELGGDHGKVLNKVVANRLVRFCCDNCAKELNATPAKFIAMVDNRNLNATGGAVAGSTTKH